MSAPAQHLLTLWNPSYTDDALDAHLRVLLDWASARALGNAEEDEVYVWWGRIRSKNRDGRLPHHADVVALDEQVRAGTETHLYLTDYRSLYVAHLGEITDDDVRAEAGETDHMPPYYLGHPVDFCFACLISGGWSRAIRSRSSTSFAGSATRPTTTALSRCTEAWWICR